MKSTSTVSYILPRYWAKLNGVSEAEILDFLYEYRMFNSVSKILEKYELEELVYGRGRNKKFIDRRTRTSTRYNSI